MTVRISPALLMFSSSSQKYTLTTSGAIKAHHLYRVETVESVEDRSVFEWDGGNPKRIVAFMHVLGLSNLKAPAASQVENTTNMFADMTVWPRAGSIVVHGDEILVKLAD